LTYQIHRFIFKWEGVLDLTDDELESLWEGLLSRQDELILKTFFSLNLQDQKAVLSHLSRMASEPGWHPEQAASARAALEVLKDKI